ncbi:orotidine-5'-phosphate decarboxylase [Agromyces seonyuensis]|uniref:Orotidine 5'-phosphate decarboxylase n=1 Tax=Agromyces seonyuensis TaxID=2662446 RepID=A0A6I4NZ49_9MICO|nr:orotidine-5'-phosphate decarboxylase [Agromyces seonyuensis]
MTATETTTFGDRLEQAFAERGRLCVGVDPHASLLDAWGLDDSAAGVREFGLRVVDAVYGRAGILKPQVSFFERHGAAGFAALERVLARARDAGLVVIGDAKRGDIGSTVEAYGEAWLRPGSPLEVDAVTLSPYLGLGSLASTLAYAAERGKGAFVLAATSNPEAAALQQAVLQTSSRAGSTVAAAMLSGVAAFNAAQPEASAKSTGSMGVVIGATLRLEDFGIDRQSPPDGPVVPVLAPGYGAQGARPADTKTIFGALARGVIVSESRSVLGAGPDGIVDAVSRRVEEIGGLDV